MLLELKADFSEFEREAKKIEKANLSLSEQNQQFRILFAKTAADLTTFLQGLPEKGSKAFQQFKMEVQSVIDLLNKTGETANDATIENILSLLKKQFSISPDEIIPYIEKIAGGIKDKGAEDKGASPAKYTDAELDDLLKTISNRHKLRKKAEKLKLEEEKAVLEEELEQKEKELTEAQLAYEQQNEKLNQVNPDDASETKKAIELLNDKITALKEAGEELKNTQEQIDELENKIDESIITRKINEGVEEIGENLKTIPELMDAIGDALIKTPIKQSVNALADSIEGLITGTKNFEEAWKGVARGVISQVTRLISEFIAQQIFLFAIKKILRIKDALADKAQAKLQFQAWAPAAVAVNTATLGTAALIGQATLLSSIASSRALGAFADGGYITGPGGPRDDRVPAMLSNGEFVINAAATRNIGVPTLQAMMDNARFPGFNLAEFAAGGLPSPASGVRPTVNVNPTVQGHTLDVGLFLDPDELLNHMERSGALEKKIISISRRRRPEINS